MAKEKRRLCLHKAQMPIFLFHVSLQHHRRRRRHERTKESCTSHRRSQEFELLTPQLTSKVQAETRPSILGEYQNNIRIFLSASPCLMDHNYRSQPSKFALSGDAPNPLRPYYIPPSVGIPASSTGTTNPNTTSQPGLGNASKSSTSSAKPSFGTAARDILSDIDYGDYLKPSSTSSSSSSSSLSSSSSSVAEAAKRLTDQAIWKYTSVFLAQPFDVAKTILQCQHAGAVRRASEKLGKGHSQDLPGSRFEGSEFGVNRDIVSVCCDC